MKDNKHVQVIPQDVLTQAQTKINEAAAFLAPYIVALTPAKRHELPKWAKKLSALWRKSMILPNRTRIWFRPTLIDCIRYGFWRCPRALDAGQQYPAA